MTRQRLIGAAVLLLALFVVRAAGAADGFDSDLGQAAKAILDARHLPCTSVRFVRMTDAHTIDVVCGYDYDYTIDLATGRVTQMLW